MKRARNRALHILGLACVLGTLYFYPALILLPIGWGLMIIAALSDE